MKKYLFSLMAVVFIATVGCGDAPASKKQTENKVSSDAFEAKTEAPVETAAPAKTVDIKGQKFVITVPQGKMTGVLYDETPIHRDNFIKLINEGFYDGLLFHRVIEGFMIQGGDPDSKGSPAGAQLGSGGPGYTLQAEILPQFIHKKGALAAARTGDQINPRRESSGSQFYIVQGKPVSQAELDQKGIYTEEQMAIYKKVGGTPMLDAQYTVFGEIIDGFDVIDKVAAVQKDRSDRPINNVVMKIELLNE